MELLDSPIRGYAWGSHTSIATLQGRPSPTVEPEAELWMGAHPDSPSTVPRDGVPVSLGDIVAADPAGVLGTVVTDRFGPRLPFMLKVLAAETPLSLQAHPDAEMAARRCADEDAAGLAHGAPERNYVDPYAKPELLVAVDRFDALCGFRDPAFSARVLESLRVPALDPIVTALRTGSVEQRLRIAVGVLLRWPDAERAGVVASVVSAIRRSAPLDDLPGGLDFVIDLGTRFPGDMGVVVTMLLHHVTLAPGEAIWMPAGNLHAYLCGTGMEVLAASDNVLRGGLTAKHVDVDELLRILRFDVLVEPVVKPIVLRPGVLTWPVPVPEFALFRLDSADGDRIDLDTDGPSIVFCAAGRALVDDGVAPLPLRSGQAALGRAGRHLVIAGTATVYVATVGI